MQGGSHWAKEEKTDGESNRRRLPSHLRAREALLKALLTGFAFFHSGALAP